MAGPYPRSSSGSSTADGILNAIKDQVDYWNRIDLSEFANDRWALRTASAPARKAMIANASELVIPDATEVLGFSVVKTGTLAAKIYDGSDVQPFVNVALTALVNSIFPAPIAVANGLRVAPPAASTAVFWVFYR